MSQPSEAMKAAIKARLALKPVAEPTSTWGGHTHGNAFKDQGEFAKGLNQEVREANLAASEGRKGPSFPTHAIQAAVRAADVLLPAQLEQRMLMIATMYLNETPVKTIAEKLNLDVDFVKNEVRKIDEARSVAYKDNPALAQKVVQTEYDVIQKTIESITRCDDLSEMIFEEMRLTFQEGMDHRQGRTVVEEDDEDEDDDEDAGKKKKKKKYAPSISPMKVDSFTKLMEVRGKQLDRLTDIFGLSKKHMPENAQMQVNNFILDAGRMNDLANSMMLATNNHIPQLKAAKTEVTVDVVATETTTDG